MTATPSGMTGRERARREQNDRNRGVRERERWVETAERKGVERGEARDGEKEVGDAAVLGVNARSARLTNIKMCTGDAG